MAKSNNWLDFLENGGEPPVEGSVAKASSSPNIQNVPAAALTAQQKLHLFWNGIKDSQLQISLLNAWNEGNKVGCVKNLRAAYEQGKNSLQLGDYKLFCETVIATATAGMLPALDEDALSSPQPVTVASVSQDLLTVRLWFHQLSEGLQTDIAFKAQDHIETGKQIVMDLLIADNIPPHKETIIHFCENDLTHFNPNAVLNMEPKLLNWFKQNTNTVQQNVIKSCLMQNNVITAMKELQKLNPSAKVGEIKELCMYIKATAGSAPKGIDAATPAVAKKAAGILPDFKCTDRVKTNDEKVAKMMSRLNGEPVHAQAGIFLRSLLTSRKYPVFMWGAAGAGKTMLARQLARMLGYSNEQFTEIIADPTITNGKFIGFRGVSTGNYVEGMLYNAWKNGGIVFLDEICLATTEAITGINPFLNMEPFFRFPNGELVHQHPDFRLIVADNTNGTGSTQGYKRTRLDYSTLSRMIRIEMLYDEKLERQLAGDLSWIADYVIAVRRWATSEARDIAIPTPRATYMGVEMHRAGFPWEATRSQILANYKIEMQKTIMQAVKDPI